MTIGGTHGAGGWGSGFWNALSPSRRSGAPHTPVATSTVRAGQTSASSATADAVRGFLRAAASGLRSAFTSFTSTFTPIVNQTTTTRSSAAATVGGTAARLTPIEGDRSSVQTTVKVNTQTSTVRSSLGAIGLDLSGPQGSRLSSAGLGLDTTSPEAASVLSSALAMGLDVTSAEAASVLGSAALGLDTTSPEAASRLQSTGEMNAGTKTLANHVHTFDSSTSTAEISGDLSGVHKALSVKITAAAIMTSATATAIKFEIKDDGKKILEYTGAVKAGEVIDLASIGVKIRFTEGSLTSGKTSAESAITLASPTVDTSAAFNASWGSAPRFENFQKVTAGSFKVNGTTIAVNANDSINSVISRINGSGAGVTAAVSGDRITLTSNGNSEDAITVGNDTSGFLAATKLAGATTTLGNVRDDQQVLAKTSQFGGVTSGSFTVNGVSIAVNRNTDTLSSIITKINNAGAGVTAAYDAQQDRIVLTGTENSEELIAVGNDSTGLLAAAGLDTANTARGNIRDDRQVLSKMAQFAAVSSGSFTLNGTTISVDTANDTVESLVARINGAGAGVTAAYDAGADALVLTATENGAGLIAVEDDTTGFLAAAHLTTNNTVRGHVAEDTVAFRDLDGFQSVTTGSFVVDGETIAVTADDTIQTIVAKINDSGAWVTASYNAASGALELETTFGTEDEVAIGGDTSGFLAAAGLDGANTVRGNIADDQQVLAKTAQFGGVASGSFDVNGVTVTVDRNTDTLQSIIAKVNVSGAGVTASYDSGSDRLVFTPDVEGATLTLDNDTTGIVTAANVATGARGTHVNADAAFDGSGASDPLLDPGFSVTAGSFTVNGVAIDVAADDTLNGVLAKITASAAGVNASWDDATQTVTLTARAAGADPIQLAGDTSGFLTAVKLDGTETSTAGTDTIRPYHSALDRLAEYAGVAAGTITVNGEQVAIDPATMSLRDVVTALDDLDGVSASLNEETGEVRLTAAQPGGSLTIDDTSGLLGALGLTTGSHQGIKGSSQVIETPGGVRRVTNTSSIATQAGAAVDTLAAEFAKLGGSGDDPAFTREMKETMEDLLDALRHVGLKGLSVTESDGTLRLAVDQQALESSLEGLGDSVRAGRAIEDIVEGFAGRVADVAARQAQAASSARVFLTDEAFAGPVKPSTASQPPAATGGTASSPFRNDEVRAQIRAQLEATQGPPPQILPQAPRRDDRRDDARTTARDPYAPREDNTKLTPLFDLFARS